MATLQLKVLGNPILLDSQGRALEHVNKKAIGLLVYLAMQPGQSFSRDALASLFWPDSETPQARQSLRQALLDLRKQSTELEPVRMSSDQTLGLPAALIDIDALTFLQLLPTNDVMVLNRAMALYRGDFMQGFTSQGSEFDQWLLEQRQHIQQQRQLALQSQATQDLYSSNSPLNDNPQIITACLQAAQLDLNNRQYHTALRFLDYAQGLSDDLQTHFTIAIQRGDILLESNALLPAIAAFEQAFKLTQDPVQQAQASVGMARGLIAREQYTAANQLLDRALVILENTSAYIALAQLHHCRGVTRQHKGLTEQALQEQRLAVKFAELAANALWLCRTLYHLAAASLRFAYFRHALTYTERCLRHAHTHNLGQFEVPCLILRGQAQLSQNRLHDSFLELEYALSLAKRDDDTAQQSLALLYLAELALWQERYATALTYSDHAMQGVPASAVSSVMQAIHVLAEHHLQHVHDDDDRIDKAYVQSLEHHDPACSAIILAILSRITADPLRRQWAWEEAERLLANLPACLDRLRFYQHAIEAAITHEHWDQARRFAKQLYNGLVNESAPFYRMFADRARLLAGIAANPDPQSMLTDLEHLHQQADELNLQTLLPAYEKARRQLNQAMDIIS